MYTFLRSALVRESRAYGFTIAFWGSGAMLIKTHGLPILTEALLYGLGAVIGFGLMTLLAYRSPLKKIGEEKGEEVVLLGMVHFLAALIPIVATHYLAQLPVEYAFFLSGIGVTSLYNIGMIVEEQLSEEALKLERKLDKTV